MGWTGDGRRVGTRVLKFCWLRPMHSESSPAAGAGAPGFGLPNISVPRWRIWDRHTRLRTEKDSFLHSFRCVFVCFKFVWLLMQEGSSPHTIFQSRRGGGGVCGFDTPLLWHHSFLSVLFALYMHACYHGAVCPTRATAQQPVSNRHGALWRYTIIRPLRPQLEVPGLYQWLKKCFGPVLLHPILRSRLQVPAHSRGPVLKILAGLKDLRSRSGAHCECIAHTFVIAKCCFPACESDLCLVSPKS
jgi:hypothetical protein